MEKIAEKLGEHEEVEEVALRERRRRKNRQANTSSSSTTTTNTTNSTISSSSSSSSSVATEITYGEHHDEGEHNGEQGSDASEISLEESGGVEESANPFSQPEAGSAIMDVTTSKTVISQAVSGVPPQHSYSLEEQIVPVSASKQWTVAEYGSTIISLTNESRQHETEVYLDKVFEKLGTHEFYCPNCKYCIKKVILRGGEPEISRPVQPQLPEPVQPQLPKRPAEPFIRCPECFSFLIPLGNWFFRKPYVAKVTDDQVTNAAIHGPDMAPSSRTGHDPNIAVHDPSKTALNGAPTPWVGTPVGPNKAPCDQNKAPLDGKPDEQNKAPPSETLDNSNVQVPQVNIVPSPVDEFGVGPSGAHKDDECSGTFAEGETPQVEGDMNGNITSIETPEDYKGPVEPETPAATPHIALAVPETPPSDEPGEDKKLEILKSIVYGGLTESIASLSVVTSAASADATTLNILTLALANLIGGLFIVGQNVWDLIDEQPRKVSSETNEQVDRYQELLGHRKNFLLHATVVVLSYLIFGLVPPVVYGFSFRDSDNRDYKLAAVAAASLACIAALAIGKAHIQKPEKNITYINTAIYYVVAAVIASGLSYIAGELIQKLIEKLGWFNSEVAVNMSLADPSSVKPMKASY